jgi:glucosamine--fructose-6-phosphate aminotransferase (isomerizing)
MCGIVGYIGQREAAPVILECLKKLEYRGYDSAGIAVLKDGEIAIARTEGKLQRLEQLLERKPIGGTVGIGHTRWATHGRPSETNAHPHRAGSTVVVHNGIIENYLELKNSLLKKGVKLESETDSEIVAHLVEAKIRRGVEFFAAVNNTLKEIQGSYSLVFLNQTEPGRLIVAKNATPIVIGCGPGESFIASDVPALLEYTRQVTFLEDGEIAEVRAGEFQVRDEKGKEIRRDLKQITWDAVTAQKGGYRHFMLKEIHEQPRAIADTFRGRISLKTGDVLLEGVELSARELATIKKIQIVACGTAWHAGLVGKFFLEEIAGIPTEVDYGSEFRYRAPSLDGASLLLLISQSGETADTLAAIAMGRARKAKIVSICNVVDSSIARKSDGVFYTHAGPEISVASTKAFTTQLTALYLLAVALGRKRRKLSRVQAGKLLRDLMKLPQYVEAALGLEPEIDAVVQELSETRDFLYLGRGINYPIALEGALKLKEISYVHAEGYPAGEMKHGPIALIDEKMPIVVLIPKDRHFQKTVGNLKEARSRGGKIFAFTNDPRVGIEDDVQRVFITPKTSHFLTPVVLTIPLQLLAYQMAVHRGTDVDQPRNLAKSVTVE